MSLCLCLRHQVKFGGGLRSYTRRYARWYHGEHAGEELCAHALSAYHEWEAAISSWQTPILNSSYVRLFYCLLYMSARLPVSQRFVAHLSLTVSQHMNG